jgi:hypothetical protein
MELFTKLFGGLLLFVYHCFDRIVINGYLSGLSRPEQGRAIELSPSLALPHLFLGISLARQGRMDEAFEERLKAHELDPLRARLSCCTKLMN